MPGLQTPLVTTELRESLNFFSQQLNYILAYWIDQVNHPDQDERYTGHRFRRSGAVEGATNSVDNPDSWFYPLFDTSDPFVLSSLLCLYQRHFMLDIIRKRTQPRPRLHPRQAIVSGQQTSNNHWPDPLSDAVPKTFHPTPAGHAATAAELVQRLSHRKPSEGGHPQSKTLCILSIDDSITWGFRSTEGSGYRKPLYDILAPSNSVSFIGSQGSGTVPSGR